MTFDIHLWLLTSWTFEGSYIVSINQVWFQLDFNFSSEVNFTFWAHLATWLLMTVDLGIWPLTTKTYKGSHIVSINQVWFQLNYNFSNEALSHFQPILQLDLRWPLTLIYDLWPHQTRVPMLHLWPNFGWNPSKHVEATKKEPNVNLFSQQTTTTTDINCGLSDLYVSFLLGQVTQKCHHPIYS